MEKSKKILKVENLKKAYYSTSRTGEIITYPVLNNVSFEIEEGEFVGIMGRSGCGKTTLLKAVGMLDKSDDGTIYYKDKDTKDIYRAELARLRRTEIAFVFQDYYLMDSLSIKENIMLPLILDEMFRRVRKNVRKWLRSLQLRIYWIKNHMNYQEEKNKELRFAAH